MAQPIPVDSRATFTILHLLSPLLTAVEAATNKHEVTRAILTHLPHGMAYTLELKLAIRNRNQTFTMEDYRDFIQLHAAELVELSVIQGTRYHTYMREDVLRWYNSDPTNQQYFATPIQETIQIQLRYSDRVRNQSLFLSEDQLIGIAYGLHSLSHLPFPQVEIISSITNAPIEINKIVENAIVYRRPHEEATERLKRPYSVDIIQSDGAVLPVYFVHAEFMQGILSVASWYLLPNSGYDRLWRHLTEFTREGIIPLRI